MGGVETLQLVCNIIILIGGAVAAIGGILTFIGKPIKFFQKQRDKRDQQRRQGMIDEIITRLDESMQVQLNEVSEQNQKQSDSILALERSMKDMLSQAILNIYEHYRPVRKIPETLKMAVDDLYHDYKELNGNHYIDNIYTIMSNWEVIPDDNVKKGDKK